MPRPKDGVPAVATRAGKEEVTPKTRTACLTVRGRSKNWAGIRPRSCSRLRLAPAKFRNAGQVCVSPTRFLVQEAVNDEFVESFTAHASAVKVGNGMVDCVDMGPLVSERRLRAQEDLIADARQKGAGVRAGGERLGNFGSSLAPTVLTDVDVSMRAMNKEPFGPIALLISFKSTEDAVGEANHLPFGLTAYAFSSSAKRVAELEAGVEAGMMTMNHLGLALPEVPFGRVEESG
jgi:succinate-semialdehyde dehydrogenase/glutarate-semialdehyde dehydrogenase